MKPTSTWGSAEHFPAASGSSHSVAAQVQQLLRTQSFIPTENFIHFFSSNDARSCPNHAACNAFCISTVFVIRPPREESKFLLTPLLTCDMHIYENLTSFSVTETGNKQSSSPSHSRRDALCEDLGRGDSRCFQQVQGWGFKGQQVEQPPTFDWFRGHVTPESSKTDPGPASQHCTSASMQLCKVTIPWGVGHCIIYQTCTVHYGSSLTQLGYIPLFPARTYNNKNTGRCTEHDVLLRLYSWRGV